MTDLITVENKIIEQDNMMPLMDIETATLRFHQVAEFVQGIMKPGKDFGIIPGTDKTTLLKPGAEKLTTFFGLTKRFAIIEKVEDWIGQDHGGEPFFYYLYRCSLYRGDLLIAEADGSCNSFESKYRYRKAERTCPECGKANIRKSKQGGGWYCWTKTDGCGATFPNGDINIERQEPGRIPNPDICDQVNTFQKMSQKRALVAATLLAVNASDFFTQDIEDYIVADHIDVTPEEEKSQPAPKLTVNQNTGEVISPNQTAGFDTNGNPAKPAKKEFTFPSDAAKNFFKTMEKVTSNYWQGNGYHFSKTMELLKLDWSLLNYQDDMEKATQRLKQHASNRRDEKAAAKEEAKAALREEQSRDDLDELDELDIPF